MENYNFYIKYLECYLADINTHFNEGRERKMNLTTVGHLISAFQARRSSLLADTDSGLISLHLPGGVPRSALPEDCFAPSDSTGTTLDIGCPLASLGVYGLNSREPLIIKSKNDKNIINFDDWNSISKLFDGIATFNQRTVVTKSDRLVKFKSKPLVFFYNDTLRLLKGKLPDLRFQK